MSGSLLCADEIVDLIEDPDPGLAALGAHLSVNFPLVTTAVATRSNRSTQESQPKHSANTQTELDGCRAS